MSEIKSNIYSIIFLPLVILIGIITTYQDWKYSKIKNRWVILGVAYAFCVYAIAGALYLLAKESSLNQEADFVFYPLVWKVHKWGINLFVATLVAYLLWHFKIWGAGDGKLFICYSALIPAGQYSKVYFSYNFSSFLLLLTIFIPATFFLFLRSIFYCIKTFSFKEIRGAVYKAIREKVVKSDKREIFKVAFGFLAFFMALKTIRHLLEGAFKQLAFDQNRLMLVTLMLCQPLAAVFKKNFKIVVGALIMLILYAAFRAGDKGGWLLRELGNSFPSLLFILLAFPFFKKTMDYYIERTTKKTTPFAHWMFLGALLAWLI